MEICSDIQEQQQSARQLLTCLLSEQTVKGHQRGNVHYLQPTAGAKSKVYMESALESLCHFLGLPQAFPVKYL